MSLLKPEMLMAKFLFAGKIRGMEKADLGLFQMEVPFWNIKLGRIGRSKENGVVECERQICGV